MGLRQFLLQLKMVLQNLSAGKRTTLIIVAVGTIAGFLFLMTWVGKADFQPLYTNLDPEDAGVILSKLKERKIPYRIEATAFLKFPLGIIPVRLHRSGEHQVILPEIPRESAPSETSDPEIQPSPSIH